MKAGRLKNILIVTLISPAGYVPHRTMSSRQIDLVIRSFMSLNETAKILLA